MIRNLILKCLCLKSKILNCQPIAIISFRVNPNYDFKLFNAFYKLKYTYLHLQCSITFQKICDGIKMEHFTNVQNKLLIEIANLTVSILCKNEQKIRLSQLIIIIRLPVAFMLYKSQFLYLNLNFMQLCFQDSFTIPNNQCCL